MLSWCPAYSRSIAAMTSGSEAMAPLTSILKNILRLSRVDGFCGSAIATVRLLSFLFCETGTIL